ncbi:hypothetical protein ACSQ6I_03910 [Anabaena sp. WFMT]|uniref:hypothetical protein n=1 Tax=Anabaena sp. WFMT TaxID=3449730 RepID=UPI003F2445B0
MTQEPVFEESSGNIFADLGLENASELFTRGKIKHVFVRNFGLCDDWKHVDEREDLQELIKSQKVPIINFPKFSYRERDLLDATRINFSQAFLSAELGILGQQRLHSFLKKAYEEIGKAQVWNVGQPAANKLSVDIA